jgi:superfamily II DNA or RNA helicase
VDGDFDLVTFSGWSVPHACRSDEDDLVRDLWDPALRRSKAYFRASGFFSSSTFRALAPAYEQFFLGGGVMTLVTSPVLSASDADAIGLGLVARDIGDLPTEFGALFRALRSRRITCSDVLRVLLRLGCLTISVAFRPNGRHAIFHEKFALFEDGSGSTVMVAGSVNESENALVRNFERVEVWRSWIPDEDRMVLAGRQQFMRLLGGGTDGLEVVPMLRAFLDRRLVVRDVDGWSPPELGSSNYDTALPFEALVPSPRPLFEHQNAAISAWAEAGGRGMLAMATGSGKTVTALSIASKLFDGIGGRGLAILIVAPLIHLVDQWRSEARAFGLNPVRCVEGMDGWRSELQAGIASLNAGSRAVISIATTPDTMMNSVFQEAVSRLRRSLLLIGDEAHNYGAPKYAGALPRNAAYRVGLSATPERWLDPVGTAAIREYFGETVFEYGLADAIRDGVLTPYLYHPVLVELQDDEQERYLDLSRRLARYGFGGGEDDLPNAAKTVMMARARLVASAADKIMQLRRLLSRDTVGTHILVYCGDGLVDTDEEVVRQIDEVIRIVGDELGMTCARYTADTPPTRRRELLDLFDAGTIQVLVAIRCLDEGVDVPSTRTAYILASSSNPRQFVQRRGRVLRRSPRTGKSVASIYDFFVIPPLDEAGDDASGRAMRGLFARQIGRAAEFSSLAVNGPTARAPLMELSKRFGLLGEWSA